MREAFSEHTNLLAKEVKAMHGDHVMNVHNVVRAQHREHEALRKDLRGKLSVLRAQVKLGEQRLDRMIQVARALAPAELPGRLSALWADKDTAVAAQRVPELYVLGGQGEHTSTLVERYDVASDSWSRVGVPQLAAERTHLAACLFNNKIVAVGGRSHYAGDVLSSAECWAPGEDSWHRFAAMASPRAEHAVVVAAEQLYAIGGFDGSGGLATVEMYSLSSKKWSPAPPLNTPRRGLAAVAIHERVFAIGGSDGTQALDTVECLDLASGAAVWRTVITLGMPLHALSAVPYQGDVLTLGGEGRGQIRAGALQHSINERQWKPLGTGELLGPRKGAAAAVANGTDVYLCGGTDGKLALSSMHRWTPTQRGWLQVAELSAPRIGAALVAMSHQSSFYAVIETASTATTS